MITLRHSFSKSMSISVMVLACIFAGKNYAFAQVDTTLVTSRDSIEVMPLQKYEFGLPDRNADKRNEDPVIDFLKVANTMQCLPHQEMKSFS